MQTWTIWHGRLCAKSCRIVNDGPLCFLNEGRKAGEENKLFIDRRPREWPDVITVFLRSLTENWDCRIIAAVAKIYVRNVDGTSFSTRCCSTGSRTSSPGCLRWTPPTRRLFHARPLAGTPGKTVGAVPLKWFAHTALQQRHWEME
jgi:hypothetical protein